MRGTMAMLALVSAAAALAAASAATSSSTSTSTSTSPWNSIALAPSDAHHPQVRLAAAQLRRFAYELELSDTLLRVEVAAESAPHGSVWLATAKHSNARLAPECVPSSVPDSYAICADSTRTTIVGATPLGVLYGATAYLEAHGVRFSLEGPIVPTPQRARELAPGTGFRARAEPVFTQRGLQPFHDFFSGPDWWSEDKYKAVAEALLGMKANQLALHTYPYSQGSAQDSTGANEPEVWVGTKEYVNADGTVSFGYNVSWANTLRAEWGMSAFTTSDPLYTGVGAQALFECDCFGHPLQSCDPSLCPATADNATSVALFNAVGAMWQRVFPYAHALGVGTTVGTEMPLSTPPMPDAMAALSVYYSPTRDDHFVTATACEECNGLYTLVGVLGYCYLSPNPAAGATLGLNTYYDGAAQDNVLAPAAPGPTYTFIRTECYVAPPAAPGSADVPVLQFLRTTPKTDHWALAGAAMEAQAQGEGYTQVGTSPLGSIWSTSSSGSGVPTVQDYYEGILTRLTRLIGPSCTDNSTGGSNGLCTYWVWTPEWFEWQSVNISNPLIQQVVNDTLALHAARDALAAPFNLATCGWVVGPLGARWYMDTVLAPDWTITSIDMDVGNTPVDPNYTNITRHAKWVIPWAEDDPGLTAPELWLNRTLSHARDAQAYGADGLLIIHWRTRVIDPQVSTGMAYAWNTSLTTADAWAAWTGAQFGPSAAGPAASIFLSVDSFDTPRPVSWIDGPGGMQPDAAQCSWASTYAFADAFAALRPTVLADITAGRADAWALERFDYWSKSFAYMRGLARFECDWASYNTLITRIAGISDPSLRKAQAVSAGYAARASLIANATRLLWDQMAEVTSPGEMGILSNLLQHSVWKAIGQGATAQLAGLAGVSSLPTGQGLSLPGTFDPAQPPLLRVPVRRTMLGQGEDFRVRCFLLSAPANLPPASVTLYTAPMGTAKGMGMAQEYTATAMTRLDDGAGRYVYEATLPFSAVSGPSSADFEWYIQAVLPSTGGEAWRAALPSAGLTAGATNVTLVYPPTAPAMPQTVVIVPQ